MPNLTYTDIPDDSSPYEIKNHKPLSVKSTVRKSVDSHTYLLPCKGVEPHGISGLFFIHGIPNDDPSKEMVYNSGITDEQLLEILIDRTEYFQTLLPCDENVHTLGYLRAALQAKYDRTAKRVAAKIEGTMLPH